MYVHNFITITFFLSFNYIGYNMNPSPLTEMDCWIRRSCFFFFVLVIVTCENSTCKHGYRVADGIVKREKSISIITCCYACFNFGPVGRAVSPVKVGSADPVPRRVVAGV